MAFNNLIPRSGAQALIPEVVSNDILGTLAYESAAMKLFRKIPMSTNVTRMPVLSALPIAYFIQGDTGLKQTTQVAWANKFLNVEEIAIILPIPENVANDVHFDIWDSVKPLCVEAMARCLDAAVFFGTNKPASWPNAIITDAIAAGNSITRGTNPASTGGLAGDISNVFGTVEADGFPVTGVIANLIYKGLLRNARTTFGEQFRELSGGNIYGITPDYPLQGMWPSGAPGSVEMFAGDFTQGILGTRSDITIKMLSEAVIQDNSGAIIFNLAQQDMIAIRLTWRIAFQVANVINYQNQNPSTRYPFGVLVSAS